MIEADVLIVGGGPAGATAAALLAAGGRSVAVLEKASFPREKVCGDCLNPNCWPHLDRLGLAEEVIALPHARLREVEFIASGGRRLSLPLPDQGRGEIAVKRRDFDALLLQTARARGARVYENTPALTVQRIRDRWHIKAAEESFSAPQLIAADGRNSTVARLLQLLPSAARDRVGLQTQLPLPSAARGRVSMRFLPQGYAGLADVGAGEANLCLVAQPAQLADVKAWALDHFALPESQAWRSITPLQRRAIDPAQPGLLLVGDAARVVEPFTGEGIYYALSSGALAADCLLENRTRDYAAAHRALYRGRLWINLLARTACQYPKVASAFLAVAQAQPSLLRLLTAKVVAS